MKDLQVMGIKNYGNINIGYRRSYFRVDKKHKRQFACTFSLQVSLSPSTLTAA